MITEEELKNINSLIAENGFLKKEVKEREAMIDKLIESAKEDAVIYQKKMDELKDEIIMYKNLAG